VALQAPAAEGGEEENELEEELEQEEEDAILACIESRMS